MKSTLKNMILSLGTLVIVSGAILAGVKLLTEKPIEEAGRRARTEAFRDVLGEFENNPPDEAVTLGDGTTVYPASKGGESAGCAVEITAHQGFGGPFRLMVGFDSSGAVTGYTVLQHAETPGLGAKMDKWFSDAARPSRNIIGRRPEGGDGSTGASKAPAEGHKAGTLRVSKDGGEIDAITGATITSRAFLDAVNRASESYKLKETEK